MEMAAWAAFIRSTALHEFVRTYEPWLWPACETLHYLGLSCCLAPSACLICACSGSRKGIRCWPFTGSFPGNRRLCGASSPASCSLSGTRISISTTTRSASVRLHGVGGINVVIFCIGLPRVADIAPARMRRCAENHHRGFAGVVGRRADLRAAADVLPAAFFH